MIDFIKQISAENDQLKEDIDTYQKRVDELEALIQSFKEEQSHIEEGILSALSRLNVFEDAIDRTFGEPSAAPEVAEKVKDAEESDEDAELAALMAEDAASESGEDAGAP
jgi:chromosome segregation ATPase